jgi:hypothetical protein
MHVDKVYDVDAADDAGTDVDVGVQEKPIGMTILMPQWLE